MTVLAAANSDSFSASSNPQWPFALYRGDIAFPQPWAAEAVDRTPALQFPVDLDAFVMVEVFRASWSLTIGQYGL